MNEEQPNGNPWIKSLLVWGGIFLALLAAVSLFGARSEPTATAIRYSDFRAKVAEGTVSEVQVGEQRILGKLKNGETFTTVPIPNDTTLAPLLQQNGVKYSGKAQEEMSLMTAILVQALPFMLILGVAFFVMRDGLWQKQSQVTDRKTGPRDL
jgi:cell division protease FtsH